MTKDLREVAEMVANRFVVAVYPHARLEFIDAIEAALLAERERCALIAESFEDSEHSDLSSKQRHNTARSIAELIRQQD